MENNLEIVCGVHPIKKDTPSTGKSTLSCNISIIHNTQNYLFAWKAILRLFVVCGPLRMTLPVPENQPYAIKTSITQQTKVSVCMENCLYASRPSACARHS